MKSSAGNVYKQGDTKREGVVRLTTNLKCEKLSIMHKWLTDET